MTDLLLIVVAAATVNNFVLVRLLGLCPLLGASQKLGDVVDLSLATTSVLTLTAGCTWLLDRRVLVPFGLPYLRIVAFILVIAGVVQFGQWVLRKQSAELHARLEPHVSLIATNCTVLGVALLNAGTTHGLAGALALGLGAGLGFSLVLILFAGLRERLGQASVPAALRGPGITLLTLGMLSLAFLGFSGIARL